MLVMVPATSVVNIRVSADGRAILKAAAEESRAGLSYFVRRRALESAEIEVLNRVIVTIAAKDWDKNHLLELLKTQKSGPGPFGEASNRPMIRETRTVCVNRLPAFLTKSCKCGNLRKPGHPRNDQAGAADSRTRLCEVFRIFSGFVSNTAGRPPRTMRVVRDHYTKLPSRGLVLATSLFVVAVPCIAAAGIAR
jgi:uncharacterized protein (DUF1778 family)